MSTPSDDSASPADPTAYAPGTDPLAAPYSGGAPSSGGPGYGVPAPGTPGYGSPAYGAPAPGQPPAPQFKPGSANPYPAPPTPQPPAMPPTMPFSAAGIDANAPYPSPPDAAPPAPGPVAYGQAPYGQPVSGGPAPYGQPSYGQPPAAPPAPPAYGQPSYGQPSYGQPSYDQPSYDQPPVPPSFGAPQAPPFGGQPAFFPGQPGPYVAPPRQSRAGLITAIIIGVVVLLCAGIGSVALLTNDKPTAKTTTAPTGGSTTTADTTTDSDTHTDDLKSYVMPFPSGSDRWQTEKSEETLDLKGAAAFGADPDASSRVLTSCDFQDGYVRRWITNPNRAIVAVRLLRFGSSSDAADYLDRYVTANTGDDWGDPTSVPGAPGASSFITKDPDKEGYMGTIATGAKGDVVVIVVANQKTDPTVDVPNEFLVTQLGKL